MMSEQWYCARTLTRAGRKRKEIFGTDRERLARDALDLDPRAHCVSTCIAKRQPDGSMWGTGNDMQWHRKI